MVNARTHVLPNMLTTNIDANMSATISLGERGGGRCLHTNTLPTYLQTLWTLESLVAFGLMFARIYGVGGYNTRIFCYVTQLIIRHYDIDERMG